jgi:hypothetical protein
MTVVEPKQPKDLGEVRVPSATKALEERNSSRRSNIS